MAEEWVVIQLDEKVARMHGLPLRVPAPKTEFEGLAEAGFELPKLKKWITSFLGVAPPAWRAENADLAKSYDRFVAKADFWQRGIAALEKKDVPGAIAAFKMVSNVDPDDHAARMNLGLAYAQSGDSEQAKKALTAVRATYEGDVDYHLALGQTYVALGDRDTAADEFALALEANPTSSAALQALAGLGVLVAVYENPRDAASLTYVRKDALLEALAEVWGEAPRDVDYFLTQVEYHASENRHDVALAAADKAIATSAQAPERAHVARASALRQLGRLDEAQAHLDGLLAKTPDAITARVERARIHMNAGRTPEADADVAAALAKDSGNLEALALRFPLERTLSEQTAGRLVELRAWAEQHPTSAGACLWLGLLQSKAGAAEDSLDTLKKAVTLAPADDDIRATYWIELGRAGKWDAVVADSLTIDMKARNWKVRWNEAEAYAALGKKVEARAVYHSINADESLPIDLRKRAKRAAERG